MWFIRQHMRRQRAAGLSVPQFRALAMIDRCSTASIGSLAEYLGSTEPTASRLVSGLVGRGYLLRKTCGHDRRQCELRLTPRGRIVLSAAYQAAVDAVAAEIDPLSDQQRQQIAVAMRTLHAVFGKPAIQVDEPATATVAGSRKRRLSPVVSN
jgi:DNA-binding MarR family transcriptional regulator